MAAETSIRSSVAALHVAKGRRLPTRAVERVVIETGAGIVGDRYHGSRHRQVSIQSNTALAEAEAALGRPVPPALTRRNITIDHGDVPRNPGDLIRLGPVLLEVVRVAAPCKLLDDDLGPGAMRALRHRGGSICRVLEGGTVEVGQTVDLPQPGSTDQAGQSVRTDLDQSAEPGGRAT